MKSLTDIDSWHRNISQYIGCVSDGTPLQELAYPKNPYTNWCLTMLMWYAVYRSINSNFTWIECLSDSYFYCVLIMDLWCLVKVGYKKKFDSDIR